MTWTHNILEGCRVYELGEDGGAWLVTNTDRREIAEAAVLRYLTRTVSLDDEAIASEVRALVDAGAQSSTGWWFDPRDESLKRAMFGSRGAIKTMTGIALGALWVKERPIPAELAHPEPTGDES